MNVDDYCQAMTARIDQLEAEGHDPFTAVVLAEQELDPMGWE